MTKKNYTEIVFVVDRSGSMVTIAKDMMGGFDTFIKDQSKLPGVCKVTLNQFDTLYETVYAGLPIKEVPKLKLEPRGSTALLDAIGRAITDTGARLAALPESKRPSHVMLVVITDGQENSSREFTKEKIQTMIKHQEDKYSWNFVFLGADMAGVTEAVSWGLSVASTAQFSADATGTKALWRGLHTNTTSYRSGVGGRTLGSTAEAYAKALDEVKNENDQ